MKKTQCDVQAVDARFLLPKLLQIVLRQGSIQSKHTVREEEGEAIKLLRKWDYETSLDCKACAIYRLWINQLAHESVLYKVLENSPSKAFRRTVYGKFLNALADLKSVALKLGSKKGFPTWGELHKCSFSHLISGLKLTDSSLIPLPTEGDQHTVNPGTSDWTGDFFHHDHGASQRLIVELTSPPIAFMALAGSNLDVRIQGENLLQPKSPWRQWSQCHYQKVRFPIINWAQLNISLISL